MMDHRRLTSLFEKFEQGTLSSNEREELNEWFHNLNLGDGGLENWIAQAGGEEKYIEGALERLKIRLTQLRPASKTYRLWPRIAAAASLLFFLSVGGYFLIKMNGHPQIAQNQFHNDVAPGSNKAILTLSNNKQISLTDAKNGTISYEGNQLVKKAPDGTLSYEGSAMPDNGQSSKYNTVTTPRGGQWPVILPDGTKVMLDAASSIKYPVSFTGNDRTVEITGQVYFEVEHQAKMPFRVKVNNQVIEDLGTHFNVNA
ncbi:MAG: FecR family protein, partial [Mucilaginibacter sp.]